MIILAAALFALTLGAQAQQIDKQPDKDLPSPQKIAAIREEAAQLLRDLAPRSAPPSVPYVQQPDQLCAKLEIAGGTIQWGNLFAPDQTVALVNLPATEKTEPGPDDPPSHYLCLFSWEDNQWNFRQFLGNVYDLTVHHRKDQPAAFLQGSRRTGRYEGDHLSWYYDPESKKLVRTDYEDWGPFHLMGNYLILERGFSRLAHDTDHWIHLYKDSKKGKLLAAMFENDSGKFAIECLDAKSGRMKLWSFAPKNGQEDDSNYSIILQDASETDGGNGSSENQTSVKQTAELSIEGECYSKDFFGFLTGLNPVLLQEDKWLDELPTWTAPTRLPVKVTGDSEIVDRFR